MRRPEGQHYMPGPRITIVNQHTNNYGDDAAGAAVISRCLEDLGAERVDVFYIWDRGAGGVPIDDPRVAHHHVQELSGERDMRPSFAVNALLRKVLRVGPPQGLRKLVQTASQSDFVLVSPAGSNIGIYKDWMYLFVLLNLVMSGVTPLFFQNTIARSNSRIFDRVARHVLRRSLLFVREKASQDWLASQGMSSYLGVDSALLAPNVPAGPVRPVLAVVPTNLSSWHRDFRSGHDEQEWREMLAAEIARTARENSLEVRLIPHLHGPEAEPAELRKLAKELEVHGIVAAVAEVAGLADYGQELAQAELVVSMRYHGLILAAQAGRPCVTLAYENKMMEAAGYLGQRGSALRIKDLTADGLGRLLASTYANRQQIAEETRDAVRSASRIAEGPLLSMRATLARRG